MSLQLFKARVERKFKIKVTKLCLYLRTRQTENKTLIIYCHTEIKWCYITLCHKIKAVAVVFICERLVKGIRPCQWSCGWITSDPQLPSRLSVCWRIPSKRALAGGAVMQAWRNDSTTRGNHMFTIHQGLIVQMGAGVCEGRHAITSRRDVVAMAWWHDGMMSSSAPHQALSSHIKQPIKSPGLWGMQGCHICGDTAVNPSLCWLWKLMF